MATAHKILPTIHSAPRWTVNIENTAGGLPTVKDIGKPVKLVSDSTYRICSDGDTMEAWIESVNVDQGTTGGKITGSIVDEFHVYADMTVAPTVGAYVVCAAQAANGVANQPGGGEILRPRVKPAADQAAAAQAAFKARIVSITKAFVAGGTATVVLKLTH